ncbi:MAG: hydantoinase [Rhodospirillaceae bacterium]|nr:hydantoinase [Rhodospirillaceae bacterium]
MTKMRVAVDIGGTFTDIVILDEKSGKIKNAKTSSTKDPIIGALKGVKDSGIDLTNVSLFSHGTTVATNALITRKLPATAMICSKGFRDVIEIRRGNKEELWDTYKDLAPPYVRRRDRLTISERTDGSGKIVEKLSEKEALKIVRILRKREIQAVAICFMNAFINPSNELRMRKIIERELPNIRVITSSETLPEIFEHERFSTTVVNAALAPVVGEYTHQMSKKLNSSGYKRDMLLLHSGGGVMTSKTAQNYAGRLAGSGIAAGAIASRYVAGLCGFKNAIGLDMGGTSTDVSLAYEGQNRVTKDWYIEYGYPIRFPSIEVLTIGAGGGSLASIDEGGSLRNGPQSAGSNPGPACYNQGNKIATNTDANVTLGRLGSQLAGGEISLREDLAKASIKNTVSKPLGISIPDAAKAVLSVANANMADAVRLISISRGYDPRDFALVAFGGAGPLHGVALAKELSIPTVIIPPNPGTTSAMGCLLVDIRHDISQSYISAANKVSVKALENDFKKIELEAKKRLRNEGVALKDMIFQRSIDMMYQGQWRTLSVSAPKKITSIETIVQLFHKEHEREYNFRRDETSVDLFRISLSAVGVTPKAQLAKQHVRKRSDIPDSYRTVWFDEKKGGIKTPVYLRDNLMAGSIIKGPAIISQLDSTTVIPPGEIAKVDQYLNIVIKITGIKK